MYIHTVPQMYIHSFASPSSEVTFQLFVFWSVTPCAFPPPQPSIFSDYSFRSTALLTGMTGISLHIQWTLTSQSHGTVSQR
jgi:hypothetical protein